MRGASTVGTRILAGVGVLGAVGFLLCLDTGPVEVRLVTKSLPMLCLLLWLWPPRERQARLIFVGLGLSLLGDVLLDASKALFLPGLGAFLLAHVSYTAAYLCVTRAPRWGRALPFLVLAVGASVVLGPHLGAMAGPVTAYVVVICTMTWRAAALLGASGLTRREQGSAFAGALLFAISDGVLAVKLFVTPVTGGSYVVMLTYWAAQLCIACSARRPRAEEAADARMATA
ncbi:lysoplasmalogenase [Myxococcus sp. AB025B]|uniref:lysoplasmalogenase n=1 Tax=Myxococcus sp. AB025B TaxID=2562794 RepID=UPI0011430894|nr:lysoplasmalogenase [Myxococcus sp. AB025B]